MDGTPVVEVDCTDTGSPADVDTLDDLRDARARSWESDEHGDQDQFRVDVPVDEAWRVLLDIERIAPCMPGAQLQEVEGDEYRGIVKVKVGPITAQYKGVARIVEADETAHRDRDPRRGPRHARAGQRVGDRDRDADARRRRHAGRASTPTSRSPARSPSSAGG